MQHQQSNSQWREKERNAGTITAIYMYIDDIYFIYNMIWLMCCQIHIGAATARCFQDLGEGFHSLSLQELLVYQKKWQNCISVLSIFLCVDVLNLPLKICFTGCFHLLECCKILKQKIVIFPLENYKFLRNKFWGILWSSTCSKNPVHKLHFYLVKRWSLYALDFWAHVFRFMMGLYLY